MTSSCVAALTTTEITAEDGGSSTAYFRVFWLLHPVESPAFADAGEGWRGL